MPNINVQAVDALATLTTATNFVKLRLILASFSSCRVAMLRPFYPIAAVLLLCTPYGASHAGEKRIYRYEQDNGVVMFTDRLPEKIDYTIVNLSCFACNLQSKLDWNAIPLFTDKFEREIRTAATRYQVDEALVRALIHAESAFNPKAISKKGAQGLMQLMPATAKDLGVNNPFNAQQNIDGGVKHLASLLKRFNGNIKLATAAYNAGAGAVSRHGGIPPFAETKTYVKRVNILYQRYKTWLS